MRSIISRFVSQYNQNLFVRSASLLVGGTAVAQVLAVLALPILTRLFSPDDFNVLAAYISIITILSASACMRYEMAIPLPEEKVEAASLLVLSLSISVILSFFLGIIFFIYASPIFTYLKLDMLIPYHWLIPIGFFAFGLYSAIQFWATREKRFGRIAKTRIIQSLNGLIVQLSAGFLGYAPIGLLAGHVIQTSSGFLVLVRDIFRMDLAAFRLVGLDKVLTVAKKYQNFPKYSVIDGFATNLTTQLPILIIASLSLGPQAGFLLVAMKVIGTPVQMVAGAVSQVFLSQAPYRFREGNLGNYTKSKVMGLAKLGILPIAAIGFFSVSMFPYILGDEWQRAGEIVIWLCPWFYFKLLSSPISMVMNIVGRQRDMMFIKVGGLAFRVLVMLLAYLFNSFYLVEAFAISGAFINIIYLSVFIKCSNSRPKQKMD